VRSTVGDRFAGDREPSLDGDLLHPRSPVPIDGTCTFCKLSVWLRWGKIDRSASGYGVEI